VKERLEKADGPLDDGYEVLSMVLRLLRDPLLLYRSANNRTRKFLNKAIFSKL
jgi:hypothetical protein